jgi:hypothetical protein
LVDFPDFGIRYQEKSGNPAMVEQQLLEICFPLSTRRQHENMCMVPKRRGEGRNHKAGKSATEITFEQSFEEKLNGSITRFPRQSPLEMFESNEF